jgi:type VI secretion system secreted protein VgrG
VDVLGKTVSGTLDGSGKSMASGLAAGLAQVFFEKDPRKPTDDGNDFKQWKSWPEHMPNEIADIGSFSATALQQVGNLASRAQSLLAGADGMVEGLQGVMQELPTGQFLPGEISLPGALTSGMPGMSEISGWGGNIPLTQNIPGGLSGFDPMDKLGDLAGEGLSRLTEALPEGLTQAVSQGMNAVQTVSNIAAVVQNPQGALAGALGNVLGNSAASGALSSVSGAAGGAIALPPLATPPFV